MTTSLLDGFLLGYSAVAFIFSIHLISTYRTGLTSPKLIVGSFLNTGFSLLLIQDISNSVAVNNINSLVASVPIIGLLLSFIIARISLRK